MIGTRHFDLVVIGEQGRKVICRCDCGNETTVPAYRVLKGNTKSCGCRRRRSASARAITRNTTHGLSGTRTHKVWVGIIDRCDRPAGLRDPNYGGRGIRVCARWRKSFVAFLADMGEAPDGMSIDRFPDVNGNYEPSNCRWATASQQAANVRPRVRDSRGKYAGGVIV